MKKSTTMTIEMSKRFRERFVQPWVEFDERHTPEDLLSFIQSEIDLERKRIVEEDIKTMEEMMSKDVYWVEGNTGNPRMLEIVKNQGNNTALSHLIDSKREALKKLK